MTTPRRGALLITPAFFGYEQDIIEELERQGLTTTLLDERPSNRPIVRAIARVRRSLIRRRIDAYYRAKEAELSDVDFELVIVIKAEVVPRWFLTSLRSGNPDARFVFYTFDAIANASNCLEVLDCFDDLLSFDQDDVQKRADFTYLPLFYTPDFTPLDAVADQQPRKYALSFVGTLHSERYEFVKTLFANRERTFKFFFVQARWYFAIVKYVTRVHRNVPWTDVSFKSLGRVEIAEVFRHSHAVVDMQRAGQVGLTMRTFEVLASGAILVTTNDSIRNEPFFDENRIIIVSMDVTKEQAASLQQTLDNLPSPCAPPIGFERYSLASWVSRLTTRSDDVAA